MWRPRFIRVRGATRSEPLERFECPRWSHVHPKTFDVGDDTFIDELVVQEIVKHSQARRSPPHYSVVTLRPSFDLPSNPLGP
eukprot:5249442-Pyramimonas_sp.AAC.1